MQEEFIIKDNIVEAINNKKIHEGQIIKNYREFCKILNEDTKGGSAKIAQIKKWESYLKIKKNSCNQSYLIEKIYQNPKYKHSQFALHSSLQETEMGGIYKIQVNNYKNWGYNLVYIGSTFNFRKRFNGHLNKEYYTLTGKLPNGEKLPSSTELLKEGGIFSIIKIFGDFSKLDKKEYEQKLREEENRTIKEYSKLNDIILINRMIDNKHIFRYTQTKKTKEKNRKCRLFNFHHENKKYEFLLEKDKKKIIEDINKLIEKNELHKTIANIPKSIINLPYSLQIGEEIIINGNIQITNK